MVLVSYISGHGLGHASRQLEVITALQMRRRDVRIVVRTSAPQWFFDASGVSVERQQAEVDTGVVQIDSLTLDEDETARRAAAFYRTFDERARAEAALLRDLGADLVIADMPPLAFAAARLAGVPSLGIGNFTWDWIYAGYPRFEELAPGVVARIGAAYALAPRALRLPMHGGFDTMQQVTRDIPLIARHAARSRESARQALGIARDAVVVLASFGGYGLDLRYDAIARGNPRLTLVVTEHELSRRETFPNLVIARDFPYPDLVAAADVVVTKPGYGIVSECVANHTALLYTDRGRFAEHDVMVAEMPRMLRCRFIAKTALLAGEWTGPIEALLAQPAPPSVPTNGAEHVAEEILRARR